MKIPSVKGETSGAVKKVGGFRGESWEKINIYKKEKVNEKDVIIFVE